MRALIIDDEPMPAKHLKSLIKKNCFEIYSTHIINSPLEAITHLKENHYDIIFLDVEMPEMNGFEVLEELNLAEDTQIIFTTAYTQYAIEAFNANAIHYILKLITKDDLVKAVRKAQSQLLKNKTKEQITGDKLSIFNGEEYLLIKQKDIIRLEGDEGYTKIILSNATHLSSKRIGYYEKKLNPNQFIRCHHSHIINIDEVVKISRDRAGYIVLSNDEIVPISRSKREFLNKLIGQ